LCFLVPICKPYQQDISDKNVEFIDDFGNPNAFKSHIQSETKVQLKGDADAPVATNVDVNGFVLDPKGFDDTFEHAFVAIGESVDAEDPHQLLKFEIDLCFRCKNGNQEIAKGIDEDAQDYEDYCCEYFESIVI